MPRGTPRFILLPVDCWDQGCSTLRLVPLMERVWALKSRIISARPDAVDAKYLDISNALRVRTHQVQLPIAPQCLPTYLTSGLLYVLRTSRPIEGCFVFIGCSVWLDISSDLLPTSLTRSLLLFILSGKTNLDSCAWHEIHSTKTKTVKIRRSQASGRSSRSLVVRSRCRLNSVFPSGGIGSQITAVRRGGV